MTADSLTKVMQCPNMMELLTTGRVNTGHSIEMKRLPPQTSVSEEDLLEGDNAIIRNTEKAIKELYAVQQLHLASATRSHWHGRFSSPQCSRRLLPIRQRMQRTGSWATS